MMLQDILKKLEAGKITATEAEKLIHSESYEELQFAKVDHSRAARTGYPEVIFCQNKTAVQTVEIVKSMLRHDNNSTVLGTRADKETIGALLKTDIPVKVNETAGAFAVNMRESSDGHIAVLTGGTSDLPAAEEAAFTAEVFGNEVSRFYDVGISGIHRLFDKIEEIKNANVIVAAAGMEGALPGVVAGLVSVPVIALPTSVGYGANFGGLSALLTMLNSCAPGIGVVNIDNGFGAGYLASVINKQTNDKKRVLL